MQGLRCAGDCLLLIGPVFCTCILCQMKQRAQTILLPKCRTLLIYRTSQHQWRTLHNTFTLTRIKHTLLDFGKSCRPQGKRESFSRTMHHEHLETITFDSCFKRLRWRNRMKISSEILKKGSLSAKVMLWKLTWHSHDDKFKFSLKARQMMTNQKPQYGIPLWLWHGFKSWNVYGTPTELGWDATMKGEEKCMEKTDWNNLMGGLFSNKKL